MIPIITVQNYHALAWITENNISIKVNAFNESKFILLSIDNEGNFEGFLDDCESGQRYRINIEKLQN